MSVCALSCAIFVRTLPVAMIVMFFFGLGYGCFLSVDFALVMDVLPSEEDVSRDMAIWHNALVLPQLLATPIGGLIRDMFPMKTGYIVLLLVTCIYFGLSAYFVRKIEKVE